VWFGTSSETASPNLYGSARRAHIFERIFARYDETGEALNWTFLQRPRHVRPFAKGSYARSRSSGCIELVACDGASSRCSVLERVGNVRAPRWNPTVYAIQLGCLLALVLALLGSDFSPAHRISRLIPDCGTFWHRFANTCGIRVRRLYGVSSAVSIAVIIGTFVVSIWQAILTWRARMEFEGGAS